MNIEYDYDLMRAALDELGRWDIPDTRVVDHMVAVSLGEYTAEWREAARQANFTGSFGDPSITDNVPHYSTSMDATHKAAYAHIRCVDMFTIKYDPSGCSVEMGSYKMSEFNPDGSVVIRPYGKSYGFTIESTMLAAFLNALLGEEK